MVPTDGASLTQEAASNDAAARPVATPEGQPVALIPVAPGEVIELPYRADELSAKLGENGNLAIKVGERTIVLQGYVAAQERAAVTLLGRRRADRPGRDPRRHRSRPRHRDRGWASRRRLDRQRGRQRHLRAVRGRRRARWLRRRRCVGRHPARVSGTRDWRAPVPGRRGRGPERRHWPDQRNGSHRPDWRDRSKR